jgi:hypothetical protein
MKCLICNADAKAVHSLGNWSEVKCPAGCGHFRISGNLVARMMAKDESFDIERTRRWLEMARNTEPVPLMSRYDYSVALLHSETEVEVARLPRRSVQ